MKTRVRIDESRLNYPLAPINAGVLSSHYVELVDVPDTVQTLGVLFEYGANAEKYRAECSPAGDGVWTCYAVPFIFPAADVTGELHYHVVATDDRDNEQWLGTGTLFVHANPANGSSQAPDVIPRDTYIRNPATGLYHKLTAAVDEDGNLTVALEDEGIER